jgi:hypothetical protein
MNLLQTTRALQIANAAVQQQLQRYLTKSFETLACWLSEVPALGQG